MRRLLASACLLALPLAFLAYDNEPDGFRGIRWGSELKELEGFHEMITDPGYVNTEYYIREGDKMKIGGAKLSTIRYKFWQERLSGIRICTVGYENYLALLDACEARFGEATRVEDLDTHIWDGKVTRITLTYESTSDKVSLAFDGVRFMKEMLKRRKIEAEEGAESDF